MYTQVLVVFVVLCVAGSGGIFSGGRVSQPGICRLPQKPCRLQVTINLLNGTQVSEMSTHICSCVPPNRCSSNWSRSDYIISRNLLSTTHNMSMNMMFCNAVQPQRICGVGEEALVVSGSLDLPYDVVAYNCRCSDPTPLLLSQRYIGSDYLFYHSYVCNNHMPTCPRRITHCATLRQGSTSYSCKCPSGSSCRVAQGFTESDGYAYCRE